jgi:hypothetical protein
MTASDSGRDWWLLLTRIGVGMTFLVGAATLFGNVTGYFGGVERELGEHEIHFHAVDGRLDKLETATLSELTEQEALTVELATVVEQLRQITGTPTNPYIHNGKRGDITPLRPPADGGG